MLDNMVFSSEWLRKEKWGSIWFFGTTELASEFYMLYVALKEIL